MDLGLTPQGNDGDKSHRHNPSTTDSTDLFVSPKNYKSIQVMPLPETEFNFGRHEQLGKLTHALNP